MEKKFGIDKNDFVITSFGFIDSTKYSLEIIKAFKNLNLSHKFHLFFIGANHGGDYGIKIMSYISNNIHVTGF